MKRIIFFFLLIQTFFCCLGQSQGSKTYKVGDISFKMVFVQGGTFMMGHTVEQGSDCQQNGADRPAHKVTLSDFCIGETEVTQALWVAVMGDKTPFEKTDDNIPANNVNWQECMEFISRLNELTGENFRLPTEAEWEFSARGGVKSKGYRYPGSRNLDEVAWLNHWVPNILHDVATKKPNELGIYDMLGNVDEWCADYWDFYLEEWIVRPQIDPKGPDGPRGREVARRVIRGYNGVDYNHISIRRYKYYSRRDPDVGFRLAL
ncbi:MAG: SUMF1/EgtB/PvdO family nonheme iron enzyme [Bacteroidales bacterium]|nr:SUMF1/EgtB/PvdO family nonheme iron enzyme [Bacteroidales bacterium]